MVVEEHRKGKQDNSFGSGQVYEREEKKETKNQADEGRERVQGKSVPGEN